MLGRRISMMVGLEKPAAQLECNEEKEKWMVLMKSAGFEPLLESDDAKTEALILLSKNNYSPLYGLIDSPVGKFLSLAWNGESLFTVSSWH
ncbi:hypothetical protein DM860_005013 [Cuscuta australis]|uniref:Uncharacterized protein n=1 Tax=Cuscuta australis TaxID=267555 RepID=A0A328DM93_9ASTE|nr:hypothetical protein DM860_005013 [Cuscuta australis]